MNVRLLPDSEASPLELDIRRSLDHVDSLRKEWEFIEDPGLGEHEFGGIYKLRILEHEERKKGALITKRSYIVELISNPRHPITMTSNWDLLDRSLKKIKNDPFCQGTFGGESHDGLGVEPSASTILLDCRAKESDDKMPIHDEELRSKIRMKCKNDWDLDLTDDQVSMCIIEMEEQGLSLFHNQIWPNKRSYKKKGKKGQKDVYLERITWDQTIDGYRAVAHRSGRFAGIDAAIFETDEDGQLIARMTVYALDPSGNPRGYVGEARFNEFVQMVEGYENGNRTGRKVPNNQWSEKPHNQLSIAAERQALRKAFQDLGEESKGFAYVPEPSLEDSRPYQAPEPDLEGSRGSEVPLPPAPKGQSGARKNSSKDVVEKGGSTASEKYVGFPKGGFSPFKMYNSDERIIMYKSKASDGNHHIALDSGFRVVVNPTGYEIKRSKRVDKFKGGKSWESGEQYFDGSIIEKVANSKNEWNIWLGLSNGSKVCLDRWGKEIKKRPRKKSNKKPSPEENSSSKTAGGDPRPPWPRDQRGQDQLEAAAREVREALSDPQEPAVEKSGKGQPAQPVDPESIETIEELRKITVPVLKRWCDTVAQRRVSPKEAYATCTGVVLKKGQPMSLEDYKVLYQCLKDELDEIESAKE